ncbi:MAG TPA: hypothetical protein VFT66_23750 [Roseiflexaceae bacterium]|nr:hypothetical protein [Roseiflexaceae bacterium]
MTIDSDHMTPAELLTTADRLYDMGEANMYRASVLEAITALEASVKAIAFPALKARLGGDFSAWIEEKTRMDFDSRLGVVIPLATGLKVDKNARLWDDYKKAKIIRNKVTHAGTKVTRTQARSVIDTVYEWLEYLKQVQESQRSRAPEAQSSEKLGRFIQASARLERVVYSAMKKHYLSEEISRRRVYPVEELFRLKLVDQRDLQELLEFRNLRNRAVHSTNIENIAITEEQIDRLNQIVDLIEKQL